MTPAPEDIGALWLQTLQRAVGRASHDVKDALNGVSVNLEVIRSRAARPGAPASAVSQFGEAAVQQFERLTTLLDAVFSLGRAERDPADVATTLRNIATLCSASAAASDATVSVQDDTEHGPTLTRVTGDAVRLALAAPLLDMVVGTDRSQRASEVLCTVAGNDEIVQVVIAAAGRSPSMPANIGAAARTAGVHWTQDAQRLTLAFPRA